MATAQELVPLLKTAVADVVTANPSSADQVMYALDMVRRQWIAPEDHPTQGGFEPSPEPPEPPVEPEERRA